MSDATQPADATPASSIVPRWVTVTVAFLAIGSYLGMIVVLYLQRDQTEQSWGRALTLYTGVQAVAFAAFGWALGTQVGQGAVTVATNQARQAGQRADAAQTAATEARADQAVQQQRVEQERARGQQLASLVAAAAPAGEGQAEGAGVDTMQNLRAHAHALYPELFDQQRSTN